MNLRESSSRPGMQSFLRFAVIALLAFLAECLVVEFANQPMPWAGVVAALVPLSVVVLIVIPRVRASKGRG